MHNSLFYYHMAERVGFEPTYRGLTGNSISSRARYGQLRYLSAGLGVAPVTEGSV